MTITGSQLSTAMVRRCMSAKQLGRQLGKSESTIYGWCRSGVPDKYESQVGGVAGFSAVLNEAEIKEHGGTHQDMFPETISDTEL